MFYLQKNWTHWHHDPSGGVKLIIEHKHTHRAKLAAESTKSQASSAQGFFLTLQLVQKAKCPALPCPLPGVSTWYFM